MKKFVGIGGGEISGWSFKTKDSNQELYQTKEIDEFIVSLCEKKKPKLLFIGTASKDNEIYFNAIKNIYENLGCKVDFFNIQNNIREQILSSDIIYIGGGNTKLMLEKWNGIGLNDILLEAYNKGVVVSGFSAGCYSFFEYNYECLTGIGVIQGISCVHYEEKSEEKRNQFYEKIKENNLPGIALDNGTAIYYYENRFKIIKSIKDAKAYKITYKNEEFLKEELYEDVDYVL